MGRNKAATANEIVMIGVRRATRDRLYEYAESQRPRMVKADVASVAIDDYLDNAEGKQS